MPRDQLSPTHLLLSLARAGITGSRSATPGLDHSSQNAVTGFSWDWEGWWICFSDFCVLVLPQCPKRVSSLAATCVPGLGRGDEGGGWKKSQHKKSQNPKPKWFILGFPVSECLLKTRERGQALFLAMRPHSERQGLCRNGAADGLASGSVYFRQGFICPVLGKKRHFSLPGWTKAPFWVWLFNTAAQNFVGQSN